MERRPHNALVRRLLLFVLKSKKRRDVNRGVRRATRPCRALRGVSVLLILGLVAFCLYRGASIFHQTAPQTGLPSPHSASRTQTTPSACLPGAPAFPTCRLPAALYTRSGSLHRALDGVVADDGSVYVTLVDLPVLDLATNLYESSLKRHGIENFLFVCTDGGSIAALARIHIDCYNFTQDWNDPRHYNTMLGVFKKKTHLKTKVALSILLLGYTVIMTDVDMVFLKNPYLFLRKHMMAYDMQLLFDDTDQTTAFYVARPTAGSVEAHQVALAAGLGARLAVTDRRVMLGAIYRLQKAGRLRTRTLDTRYFRDGKAYFETGMRMFYTDNPCHTCVAVHNNWVYSHEGKVYRMKENLLWYVDNAGYYSSTTTRYMAYTNPPVPDADPLSVIQLQLRTLRDALTIAFLLQRVLILPTFHCGHCQNEACHNIGRQCSLSSYLNMQVFDAQFGAHYREHVFLAHPRVPDSVHRLVSRPVLIRSLRVAFDPEAPRARHVFTPRDAHRGAEPPEVVGWFSASAFARFSVLQFQSLYGAFAGMRHQEAYRVDPRYQAFARKLIVGLREVNYRQLYVDHTHSLND